MNKIQILDCTLRDGSYVIDYQFSSEDSYLIAKALSSSGIEYIEVGHGLGLDAQYRGNGAAKEDDVTYVRASVDAVKGSSKIGVFFIPGIGIDNSIKRMADAGLDFIRIGVNADSIQIAKNSIKEAKKNNLEVSLNLMKSYILSPSELAKSSYQLQEMGADTICVVDSAGGMTPDQVRRYIGAVTKKISREVGFHGHNNLRLADANCIAAIESGATIVDTTLRGMGRSAGNAATEIIANILSREGYDIGEVNPIKLMEIAERVVAPLLPRDGGPNIVDIASGISFFHSGFQGIVDDVGREESVEPYKIILGIGEKGKSNVTAEMARSAAKEFRSRKKDLKPEIKNSRNFSWKTKQPQNIEDLFSSLKESSSKTGFLPILTISRSSVKRDGNYYITPIHIGSGFCVGHIESVNKQYDEKIFQSLEHNKMVSIIDTRVRIPENYEKLIKYYRYDEDHIKLNSVMNFVRVKPKIETYYLKENDKTEYYQHALNSFLKISSNEADIGIVLTAQDNFGLNDVNRIKSGGHILLAEVGAITSEAIKEALKRNIVLQRVDLSEVMISEVYNILKSQQRLSEDSGRKKIGNITIVSGGILAKKGEIVVNSIKEPRVVYGIADGFGSLKSVDTANDKTQNAIKSWIFNELNTVY